MRRPLPLALAALAVLGALTACAPEAAPQAAETPAPTTEATPTATPPPTPTATVVAAGQLPPPVFDGDCASAVPAGLLTAATGIDGIEVTRRDLMWTRAINNVGGLVCEWHGGNVSGDVTILPKRGLDGATLPAADARYYFEACDWGCSWQGETDALWISGYSSDLPELGRSAADRIGAAITDGIAGHEAAAGLDWELDRTRWWQAQDCADMADRLGARINATVTAQEGGYHDPPGASTTLADIASRLTWCGFETEGRQFAHAMLRSGVAWDVPAADLGRPVDLGVPGVEAFLSDQGGYLGGQVFEATDGVNGMTVEVAQDAGWPSEQLAAAFAAEFVAP